VPGRVCWGSVTVCQVLAIFVMGLDVCVQTVGVV